MKMKYKEEEETVEDVLKNFARFTKFINEKETKKFIKKWHNKHDYKKVGLIELLFSLWNSSSTENKEEIFKKAEEILEKLKGTGGVFSFLNKLKLKSDEL